MAEFIDEICEPDGYISDGVVALRRPDFEVLAPVGDADVFGVFEFGDGALGYVDSTGEFYLVGAT